MAAGKSAKKAKKTSQVKARAGGARTQRVLGLGGRLLHELFLLLGLLMVILGFCEPWLVVETADLAQALLGLPPSAALPAWRLPAYAREVESAWVVEVVRLFGEGQPDTGRIWWVFASPISALVGWFVLRAGGLLGRISTALIQGAIALFLATKLLEGLGAWSSDSMVLRFGAGLLLSALGHALIFVMALETIERNRRR